MTAFALALLALFLWVAGGAPAAAQGAGSIGGTMENSDGEPIEGVRFEVEQDGRQVGDDETGDDGTWRVAVPAAGVYQVTIDPDTLPEDQELRNPDRTTLENVSVREGQDKRVLFPLEAGGGGGPGRLDTLSNLFFDGLLLGAIVALAAVGLSLIFGVTGLVNFAHGELLAFGALVAVFLNVMSGGPGWHLILAAAVAIALGGGFGWLLETGLWRPLRHRRMGSLPRMVVSIGLALVLRHIFLVTIGASPRPYGDYTVQRAWSIGPVDAAPKEVTVIVLALVVLLAFGAFLRSNRIGIALRAVSNNKDLAESTGIDVERIIRVTWTGGTALAAFGGILYGLTQTARWDMGLTLLLPTFAAVVLGGLGTAYGAMAGALVLGVVSEMSTYWIDVEFKTVVSLSVLILVLLIRPQGIFGMRERIG